MFALSDVASSESSADSDDSQDDVVDNVVAPSEVQVQTRTKRAILWCGVEDDPLPSASTTSYSASLEVDQHGRHSSDPYANVPLSAYVKGVRLQLFSQSKQFLAIYADGEVRGTRDKSDPHTRLEMIPTGYPGHVVIRGLLSNLYISMNNKGRLKSQGNRDAEMSVFVEGVIGFYFYYLSRHHAHLGWYLGLKKTGKFKNGKKTKLNQKAVRFLKLYP